MLTAQILDSSVRDYFAYLAPTAETQVLARWIVVDDQTKADQVVSRLNAGDDFVAVGQELSLDPAGAERGQTDTDWLPRGSFPNDDVESFLFDAAPGARSDPISVGDYLYIVQLLNREEDHPLGEAQRDQVVDRDMTAWLDGLDVKVENNLTTADATKAIEDIL